MDGFGTDYTLFEQLAPMEPFDNSKEWFPTQPFDSQNPEENNTTYFDPGDSREYQLFAGGLEDQPGPEFGLQHEAPVAMMSSSASSTSSQTAPAGTTAQYPSSWPASGSYDMPFRPSELDDTSLRRARALPGACLGTSHTYTGPNMLGISGLSTSQTDGVKHTANLAQTPYHQQPYYSTNEQANGLPAMTMIYNRQAPGANDDVIMGEASGNDGDTEDQEPVDPSYAKLLFQCLKEQEGQALPLRDIYTWISRNSNKAKEESTSKGWQNSVRHNLSMNAAFVKVPASLDKHNKRLTSMWRLTPDAALNGVLSTTRYRKETKRKSTNHNRTPAKQRQDAGAKGGQATRAQARLRARGAAPTSTPSFGDRVQKSQYHGHQRSYADQYGHRFPSSLSVSPMLASSSATSSPMTPAPPMLFPQDGFPCGNFRLLFNPSQAMVLPHLRAQTTQSESTTAGWDAGFNYDTCNPRSVSMEPSQETASTTWMTTPEMTEDNECFSDSMSCPPFLPPGAVMNREASVQM